MTWYDHLYIGRKAKGFRSVIIQGIQERKFRPGVYVITPPSNGNNILDIYPSYVFCQEYYAKQDRMILGIALGYKEALKLAGQIVDEMYRETGGFQVEQWVR